MSTFTIRRQLIAYYVPSGHKRPKSIYKSESLHGVAKWWKEIGVMWLSSFFITKVDFARSNGALVSKDWKDTVTHVIAATYSNGVSLRTLKVPMAILNGKWIVTMEWLKAYVEA
ncbi:hypothetical protein L1987_84177 [Smallanthus sonchifolius]|uniref:Uncharacterized protein n=1 Tax=Smallanthus sonchifolius TaxID=185202 RepID=A0ACB8YF65_9ASTR|nr:hypothetical protein L1987_84177 [Smallanthus sonchifolius]